MTRLVLLEHAPARFRPEPDDTIVAMTPEACYELDRQGVTYKLTTDFGIETELAALEPLYWQDQLRWIDAFDQLIARRVPETRRWRFGAATLYGYWLKTLMDPVWARALELVAMLDSCDRVVLHRRAEADPPVSWELWFEGPSVTSLVLPLVAAARGIAYEERVDKQTPPLEMPPLEILAPVSVGLLKRLRAPLRRGRSAFRRGRNAWRHARLKLTPRTRRLTLLFADSGYDLHYLLPRARDQGHRCLRVVGDTVVEEGRRSTEVARLPVEGPDAHWASAAEAIASPDHPLWEWPNGWLPGAVLANLVRPRVVYWLRDVMPRVAARAAAFEDILGSESVDFVLGANIGNPDVLTAAAVTTSPTQSAIVDHGDGAFAPEAWDLFMLPHADHYFCATNEVAEYMESRRSLYDRPTAQIQVGSYRWRANASMSRSEQPPQPLPKDRPVVVYALTSTPGGNSGFVNGAKYSEGWYYRLCRKIVDVLAQHPEVFSVVKLFPGDGHLRNPIDLYVDDLRLDHVVWSRAPLRAWIPWAERIVFDFPSTGLYETAAAGIPYLTLLYTHHRHRPGAVERLGPAAVRFTEPAEAARAVDAFVSAPTVAAPRLYPEGEEILTTLERFAR